MQTQKLSRQPHPKPSLAAWCIVCIAVVLLGNVWNVWSGATTQVTLFYAAFSSVFAILAGISVAILGWVRS